VNIVQNSALYESGDLTIILLLFPHFIRRHLKPDIFAVVF